MKPGLIADVSFATKFLVLRTFYGDCKDAELRNLCRLNLNGKNLRCRAPKYTLKEKMIRLILIRKKINS